jgi:putative transposase
MSKLLTAYSSYFNKKYDRTGSLFSSEFKSSHLDTDEYLKYIYSYIHLNPIKVSEAKLSVFEVGKERAFKILESYAFSSYLDYQGSSREENIILNKEKFPEYFRNQNDFKDYIFDWIKLPNSEQTN